MKLSYLRGAVGLKELIEEHEPTIRKILRGDYSGHDLERLYKHNVWSLRLNKKARFLFTVVDNHLVVLEYLPNHNYHTSHFLRSGVLNCFLMQNQDAMEASVSDPATEERFQFASVAE